MKIDCQNEAERLSSGSILVFTLTKLLSWCLPDTGEVIQTVCCSELVSSKGHYVTCNAKPCLTQTLFSQKTKYIDNEITKIEKEVINDRVE